MFGQALSHPQKNDLFWFIYTAAGLGAEAQLYLYMTAKPLPKKELYSL